MIRFWRLNERTVDNLGLACTEDGLFLGRTPLIERRDKRYVVRSRDEKGKEFLEFATALNVSAGGALVAVRRSLPPTAQVLLEIPSAPLAATAALPKAARTLRAKTLRISHAEGYHLLGLKFSRPLLNGVRKLAGSRRKLGSAV